MAVHGYPHHFLLVGADSGLGHNSIVFMIEAQCDTCCSACDGLTSGD